MGQAQTAVSGYIPETDKTESRPRAPASRQERGYPLRHLERRGNRTVQQSQKAFRPSCGLRRLLYELLPVHHETSTNLQPRRRITAAIIARLAEEIGVLLRFAAPSFSNLRKLRGRSVPGGGAQLAGVLPPNLCQLSIETPCVQLAESLPNVPVLG